MNSIRRRRVATLLGVLAPLSFACGLAIATERSPAVSASGGSEIGWTWVRTGSPNVPRRDGGTATLLANGKVLLVGGAVGLFHSPLDSAELYDPATGTWSVTGALHFPRNWHTATLLPDGRVLVAGGDTVGGGTSSNTAEVYNPTDETWSMTGRMADPRLLHAATLLKNGKVLVMAGSTPTVGACELYDPATGQWSRTGDLVVSGDIPGDTPTATLLQNGRVLLVGGTTGEDLAIPTSAAELYDPDAGQWRLIARLPEPRADHSATLLPDGQVMIAGGWGGTGSEVLGTSIVYDPSVDTWGGARTLKQARTGHTATLLPDGTVMVAGGAGTVAGGGADAEGVESYNVGTAQWDAIGEMNVARGGHTATLLLDGRVLVVGGDAATSAEIYEPAPPGTVVPAYTGSWFDAAQPGHGLVVEVLPSHRFVAAWFAFNPAGTEQAWFMGTGTYRGNTATITDVVQPTGGRWIPNFDPARIVSSPWGTLTFTFTDCNHGRVDFSSTVPGYGSGSMNLTRLTQPTGLACP